MSPHWKVLTVIGTVSKITDGKWHCIEFFSGSSVIPAQTGFQVDAGMDPRLRGDDDVTHHRYTDIFHKDV